ncbi:MAG: LysR family transcriptional regulator [Acidimicrobiales bacterium]|nr:LysR family transcriptional regulator [Acidimicrobiales bacterium]
MELRQVEHFVAVVDEEGFTAAADAVGITQPALSQSVAALERELGTPLFVRAPRRVSLTAAGEALLGPARQLLRAAREARASVEGVVELAQGTLDLVALPTLAVDPLTPLLGRFRAAHPGVEVRVAAPDQRVAVLDQVRRGDAELGLTDLRDAVEGLDARPVADQEVVLAVAPGTRIGRSRRQPRDVLGRLEMITTPTGTATRDLLEQACSDAGVEPHVAVVTDHREMLAPLVVAGGGAALLAASHARDAAAAGADIVRLDPPLSRRIGFVHRPGPLSPAAAGLLDLL